MGVATRSFQPGHFFLEIGGVSAGYLRNLQGGGAVADVIAEKVGADHIVRKHVGGVHFDDIVLTCDAGLSTAFYDWVDQTTRSPGVRRDGAVVIMEGSKQISRLEWNRGLITRVEFPALDAKSKEPFSMTVKITPEITRSVKGGDGGPVTHARKTWLAGSYRLRIDGLEEACKHVSRIEPVAIVWKAAASNSGRGGYLDSEIVSTEIAEPGNLIVTLPEAKAQGFQDWFQDFVIKGNSGPSKEKRGTLETGSFSVEFGNLGPTAITRPSNRPGDMIRRTRVEMYCESIQFHAKSA